MRKALLHSHGNFRVTGPPSFLFDMRKYEPAAPWKSFLRGPLIVSVRHNTLIEPLETILLSKVTLSRLGFISSIGIVGVSILAIALRTRMV